jgi:diguanylate cyclase
VIFLALGGAAVLSLAAVGRAPLVVRVLAVAVVLLAAAGVRVLGFDRTSPRDQHRSWVLLELGFVILAAGSLLGIAEGSGTGTVPAAAAVAALTGALLVGTGLAVRLNVLLPGRALGAVFEALMCTAALALVTWGALLMDHRAPLANALALLVPLADAVLIWLALRLARLSRSEPDGFLSLAGTLTGLLVVDAVLALGSLGVLEIPAGRFEVLRLACVCLGAAAALAPSLRRGVDPAVVRPPRLGTGRLAATLGLTLLAPALFAVQGAAGDSPRLPAVLVGASILPFLVAVYLVLQVHEGARAEYQAQHDPLTGLPHRVLYLDRLEVALGAARRTGKHVAVLFLDLDRFKAINDSLGHAVGNQLLQAVAWRIERCVREADTVARMGGDEFMVLLPEIDGEPDCLTVAEKLLHSFVEPFPVDSRQLVVSTSIGVAIAPEGGADAETLMKNADIAMYRAKANGRATYQIYTADLSARALVKHSLESNLRSALEAGDLELHYQPKIDSRTHRVVGLEALARWDHPKLGFIPPATFIPLAEETGLIVPFGSWVLEEACHQIGRWSREYGIQVPVAINLSAEEFTAKQIDARVAQALDRNGVAPHLLELEITESSFLLDLQAASATMRNLLDIGVQCSIDDFGTGYSGLKYLAQIPLHSLKIDQSFVQRIGASSDEEQIVNAVITLARSLRMKVIAEGVETGDQATFLLARGCDQMQGFLFSPALAPRDIERFMGSGRHASARSATHPNHGEAAGLDTVSDGPPELPVGDLLHALCTYEDISAIDESRIAHVLDCLHPRESTTVRRRKTRRNALQVAGSWSLG